MPETPANPLTVTAAFDDVAQVAQYAKTYAESGVYNSACRLLDQLRAASEAPPADGDLRDRLIEALNTALTTPDGGIETATTKWDRHDRHNFLHNCAACKGDVPSMVDALWPVIGPLLADRDDELERMRGELAEARDIIGRLRREANEQCQRAEQAEDRLRKATDAYTRLSAQADDAAAARDRWQKRGKQAEAEQDALKAAIAAAKAEHRPIECCNMRHDGGNGLHCAVCEYEDPSGSIWPCPTYRALDAPSGADSPGDAEEASDE